MAFWRRKKKKEKEKRKGLPRPPTRITSALTLIVVLGFIALWFLVVRPPAPPVPVNFPTPTLVPVLDPSRVGTPVVAQTYEPLQLIGVCTDAPNYRTIWQVLNPNPYAVKFTALTRSLATWATQPGTVPAMSNGNPGVLQLRSYYESPMVMMSLTVEGSDLSIVSMSNAQPCAAPTASPSAK